MTLQLDLMNRCTLRWEPSSDDGGADVRHYVLEYFRDVWNVWLKAKTTKDCQVAVDDLIPGSRSAKRATALHCQFPDMEGVVVNVMKEFHNADRGCANFEM